MRLFSFCLERREGACVLLRYLKLFLFLYLEKAVCLLFTQNTWEAPVCTHAGVRFAVMTHCLAGARYSDPDEDTDHGLL